MANSITYKEATLCVGDTIKVDYVFKEGEKQRQQAFEGILLKVKGATDETRMITVRKMSKIGVGVERIIPLISPFIAGIKVVKKSTYTKSKLYFVRDLSDQNIRKKLYHQKSEKKQISPTKKTAKKADGKSA